MITTALALSSLLLIVTIIAALFVAFTTHDANTAGYVALVGLFAAFMLVPTLHAWSSRVDNVDRAVWRCEEACAKTGDARHDGRIGANGFSTCSCIDVIAPEAR